ncbi:MAG: Holliday junction resolvase RuvX [Candidatus Omnitrophica bacterium]|nr:Holliday junction resolvase RuvX [Candidatus Omnitrophota bacterium]MCM8810186.1 Holliday junction resolvase RuvX [Candidatus Omnitrophota bacterium]MCM8832643.1 Holliday junction resolvase RuvX [Candidatus Omnitrophota bacterium]
MRILCIDIGDKNIGVAISDEENLIARGLGTIKLKEDFIDKIKEIIKNYNVGKIVYGLPLKMDGSFSIQTEKTMAFISKLKQEIKDVEFVPFDERFTTTIAERFLISADLSRKKRKKYIDKLSAQIILQNYLDSLNIKINRENVE